MTEKKYATFRDLKQPPAPTSTTSTSSRPRTPRVTSTPSIAPERDFQRVPNSVTKRAMAEGQFRGKSKQVYDYLWSVSRGAIIPVRQVRKSRKEIKAGSGLGSMVTVDAAINHLLKVGLLSVKPAIGSLVGNTYEVFTPEEASTSTSSTSSTTSLTQNLVVLDIPESSTTRRTQTIENKTTSSDSKTSFKTNTERSDDDEAGAAIVRELKKVIQEITGREATALECSKMIEVIEVIALEGKIAAARTTVSSAGPFLAEHLRRRLFKKNKQELAVETAQSEPFSPAIDVSQCSDCAGVGWYYPEGKEKGMARCRHLSLK